jgi:hypothetical protein
VETLWRKIQRRLLTWWSGGTGKLVEQPVAEEPKPQGMNVFLDLLPNQPKDDQGRANFRHMLRERFDARLPESVERIWDLPPIVLKEPTGDYVALLLEARELFVAGYFYSCVAMCGIVGERLVKDVLRASVLVEKEGQAERPKEAAFDQLERVDTSGLARFLKEAGLLGDEAAKAADKLGQLRNGYAHARGKDSPKDAIEAIRLSHILVEGTVSVFKEFEIRDGAFVRKGKPPKVVD